MRSAIPARALLFTILSALWLFPSLGACWILASNPAPWRPSSSLIERVNALNLEQWCAVVLLALQAIFLALAIYFRRSSATERFPRR